jgi:hypothetical protein
MRLRFHKDSPCLEVAVDLLSWFTWEPRYLIRERLTKKS